MYVYAHGPVEINLKGATFRYPIDITPNILISISVYYTSIVFYIRSDLVPGEPVNCLFAEIASFRSTSIWE